MGNSKQNEIKELRFPNNIRQRSGMYIGSVNDSIGPAVIIREAIDNSIDEVLKGTADTIYVYVDKAVWHKDDGSCELDRDRYIVADNGSGMPIAEVIDHDKDGNEVARGITQCELAVGTLHAGSKFNKTDTLSTGMNGVGVSVSNALSDEFVMYCKLDKQYSLRKVPARVKEIITGAGVKIDKPHPDYYYKIKFEKGIKLYESIVNINDEDLPNDIKDHKPATITLMIPDRDIWYTTKAKMQSNVKYLRYIRKLQGLDTKYYLNGVEDTELPESYKYSLSVRVNNSPKPDTWIGPYNEFMDWYVSFEPSEVLDDYSTEGSVNTLSTPTGKHIKMFENCYSEAFESIFGSCHGRASMGINKLIIMNAPEVSFSSQTKEKLDDVAGFPYRSTNTYPELVSAIRKIIKNNYEEFSLLHKKILEYLKSVENLSKMQVLESKIPLSTDTREGSRAFIPIKLKDATCKDRSKCELYIVEGNSAEGPILSARTGMDNIAVLALRGKPKNTSGMDILDVLDNSEMYDLILSMGAGVDDRNNIDALRYGKVIIAADADPDGAVIAALVLGAIIHHLSFLIEAGVVYLAMTPLYLQDGKTYYLGEEDKVDFNRPLSRYKGLGETNSKQLKRWLLDPETRKLFKVTPSNMNYAKALLSNTDARRELMMDCGLVTDSAYTFDAYVKSNGGLNG